MNRSLYFLVFLALYFLNSICTAQEKTDESIPPPIQPDTTVGAGRYYNKIQYHTSLQAIGTTGGVVPFWMRSNQYGSIPLSGASSSFMAGAKKEYNMYQNAFAGKPKRMDWGIGFEGRVNTNISENKFILTEAYLKGRLGPFELKGGRSKETMGLTGDTTLSSGSFAVSGNALGMPKIEISFPQYYTLPILDRLIAIKGNFAHGWVGKTATKIPDGPIIQSNTFLHQKSFYGRLGKPESKLKLYGGFNHQVYWGNEKEIFGNDFDLTPIKSSLFVFTGRKYGNHSVASSKIGNHMGSIDMAAEYNVKDLKITAYHQFLYDVGALYYLANLRDGLTGIALKNVKLSDKDFQWKKIVFEFLYTKNQAGELTSKITKSGDENYYNNYIYREGWSYKKVGLGTPLISTKLSTQEEHPDDPSEFFINNRVIALHLGITGSFKSLDYGVKLTKSENYGTFGTSQIGRSLGSIRTPPRFGTFIRVPQYSSVFELNKKLKYDYVFTIAMAIDNGGLLNKSTAAIIKLTKVFYQ